MEDREVQENNNDNEIQDIPRENSIQSQNTIEACPDEEVLTMNTEILRTWEVVKEQHIGERPSLPKIRKDQHVWGASEAANKAIKEIKEEINTSLTLTDINQIVYATALTIIEQIGIKPKKYKKANSRKRKTSTWKAKFEMLKESEVIYQSYQKCKRAPKSRRKKLSKLINIIRLRMVQIW